VRLQLFLTAIKCLFVVVCLFVAIVVLAVVKGYILSQYLPGGWCRQFKDFVWSATCHGVLSRLHRSLLPMCTNTSGDARKLRRQVCRSRRLTLAPEYPCICTMLPLTAMYPCLRATYSSRCDTKLSPIINMFVMTAACIMTTTLARLKFETKKPPDVASVDDVETVEKAFRIQLCSSSSWTITWYLVIYTTLWLLTSHIRYRFAGAWYC